MTLVEYLFRVFVYLLTFTGTGVTTFWGVRVIGIVRSETARRGRTDDCEP